ncbi:hypothetical protein M233_04725 [Xylella fastidiosa subsp. multiplex Griffin-1]|nr:hypothetical protein M233_04725 [Xylella fastidiosa subsp. multiplex Griffin-1]
MHIRKKQLMDALFVTDALATIKLYNTLASMGQWTAPSPNNAGTHQ